MRVNPWRDQADHYENFPVGSLLVPARLRPAFGVVYRFARYGDDVADEGSAPATSRLAELERMRDALHGRASHEVVTPLEPVIAAHRIDPALFEALLDAFCQDVRGPRYETDAQVLDYCTRSANPVGRIVLRLFNADRAECLPHSDAICTALQLINFGQDIGQDIMRGRCYISDEALEAHGLVREDLVRCARLEKINPSVRTLLNSHLEQCLALLGSGTPLLRLVAGRLRLELAAIVAGGRIILKQTSREDPFASRLKLKKKDLPSVGWLAASLAMGRPLR